MKKKYLALFFSIVLAFTTVYRLLGNPTSAEKLKPTVISFMADFYEFWEKAKNKPIKAQISLWDTLFESKHQEFYQQIIYSQLNEDDAEKIKLKKLNSFLNGLGDDDIQNMKDCEQEIIRLIPSALSELEKILPEEKGETSHFIIPSLNTSSGAARPFKGDMIVYYGMEVLSKFENPAEIKALIAHETFHIYQFRRISSHIRKKFGNVSPLSAYEGESLLFFSFMEGLTVYAVEKLYPGVSRPGIMENLLPLYERNFFEYTAEFYNDIDKFNYNMYQKYFIDPSDDPVIPAKFGYWLGYRIIKSLDEKYSIQEMMNWIPEQGIKMMRTEIEKIVKKN